jgi:hypothetical protein
MGCACATKGRSMIYTARFETMNELLGFLTETFARCWVRVIP